MATIDDDPALRRRAEYERDGLHTGTGGNAAGWLIGGAIIALIVLVAVWAFSTTPNTTDAPMGGDLPATAPVEEPLPMEAAPPATDDAPVFEAPADGTPAGTAPADDATPAEAAPPADDEIAPETAG